MRGQSILVLVSILAITSSAGATISFSGPNEVDLGESVEIDVVSDTTDFWWRYLGTDAPLFTVRPTWPHIQLAPNYYGYWELSSPEPPFAGVQYICTLTSTGSDLDTIYHIWLLDSDWSTVLDTHTVTVVPEPMTIALLALGAVLIRKKR